MANKDYKITIFADGLTYYAWRAMFMAKCKSEKLQKYIDGLAILLVLNPQQTTFTALTTFFKATTGTVETPNILDKLIKKEIIEAWLEEKETYEIGFKQANKKIFIDVDQIHLTTILKLSDSKDMFHILDQKYSTLMPLIFGSCSAIAKPLAYKKNIDIMEKHKSMLNLNAKICI